MIWMLLFLQWAALSTGLLNEQVIDNICFTQYIFSLLVIPVIFSHNFIFLPLDKLKEKKKKKPTGPLKSSYGLKGSGQKIRSNCNDKN